ncbi:hypothetical protein KJ756_02205 [Patescibacteria group bacterium]|nr:hypothetical protein [Patescibacteria group bacterium]MCG2809591.1 hypothetical protein [Candidatus Portnoybacteria bacterium]
MNEKKFIPSPGGAIETGGDKKAESEVQLKIIERKLDEILLCVKNDSEIMEHVKKELISEIESRTEEIKIRLRTILKDVL